LRDLVSNLHSSSAIPTVNIDSSCSLAFKLMHENSLNFVLVEKNNGEIVGIVTDKNLIEAVNKSSFDSSIKKNITKVKKVKHNQNFNSIIKKIMKDEYLLVYRDKEFYGILNITDVLWKIKKEGLNA